MSAVEPTFKQLVRLLGPLFGVIFAVWFLRLVLAAAGAPGWLITPFSITGIIPVSTLLAVLLIHVKRAGGYAQVVLASVLLAAVGQLLISLAIAFTMVTGVENVFSAPGFTPSHSTHLEHLCAHLLGIILFSALGSIVGCFFLWLVRVLMPNAGAGTAQP